MCILQELIGIIDSLQKELSMEKYQALKMEARVRAEVVQEMKKQFIDIEQDYRSVKTSQIIFKNFTYLLKIASGYFYHHCSAKDAFSGPLTHYFLV